MRATRRAPAGGGARDGDGVVPEPRPSLLCLFNCRIGAPMDGPCLRWRVLHALLLMSPRDRAQLPAHAQLFLNQVLACPSRSAQMAMLCRLCIRSAMNEIDCKIVVEEYVLLGQFPALWKCGAGPARHFYRARYFTYTDPAPLHSDMYPLYVDSNWGGGCSQGCREGRPSAPSPGGMRRTNPPHSGRNLFMHGDRAGGLHSLAYRLPWPHIRGWRAYRIRRKWG